MTAFSPVASLPAAFNPGLPAAPAHPPPAGAEFLDFLETLATPEALDRAVPASAKDELDAPPDAPLPSPKGRKPADTETALPVWFGPAPTPPVEAAPAPFAAAISFSSGGKDMAGKTESEPPGPTPDVPRQIKQESSRVVSPQIPAPVAPASELAPPKAWSSSTPAEADGNVQHARNPDLPREVKYENPALAGAQIAARVAPAFELAPPQARSSSTPAGGADGNVQHGRKPDLPRQIKQERPAAAGAQVPARGAPASELAPPQGRPQSTTAGIGGNIPRDPTPDPVAPATAAAADSEPPAAPMPRPSSTTQLPAAARLMPPASAEGVDAAPPEAERFVEARPLPHETAAQWIANEEPPAPPAASEDPPQRCRPDRAGSLPETSAQDKTAPAPGAPRGDPKRQNTNGVEAAPEMRAAEPSNSKLETSDAAAPQPRIPAPPLPAPLQQASGAPPALRQEARERTEATPARVQLAFGARLVPTPPRVEGVAPLTNPADTNRKPAPQPDEVGEPAFAKQRQSAPEIADPVERPGADRTPMPPPAQRPAEWSVSPESQPAAAAKPEETPLAARPATPPETAKAPPVVRDIRFEVTGAADHKVEVRLMERAGELHLSVRTPDDRLAGVMREHLPLLSSRLEESGFRADGWHAAEAGAAERRLDVEPSAANSADAGEHGHKQDGNDRGDADPQRCQTPEEADRKKKGTSFEWLLSSLR